MKLIFLYLVVALCVFCKDGEALFYRQESDGKIAESTSEKQKRELGGFLFSNLNFADPNRRKKSLVGSLLDLGFNARERAEDRWRKHRDTDSLVLKDTPAEKTRSASGFANGISGGSEFGGTASNQNDIGRGPSGQSGFDVNAVSGLADSNSAPSETADNTNTRHRDGFSSSVSGNLGFGLGTSDQKGLDIGRADWSEMSNRRSAGGESIGFGFDAHSPVGTGSFGWELGKRKGNNAFGFGASGSSSFGGSGIDSKIKIEGNQVGSSGGPISNDLGGISARIRDSLFDGISENLRYGFEKFGQKGFGSRGSGWSKSSRESDVSGSVEKSSSSDLKHGERKREAKFDFGDSGSNRFDDIGLSENVIKAGDSNARNGDEYSSGISEDSGFNLGSSDQQGFGISGIGRNGESGSGIVGAGYLSPGSDVSGTGENTWSSGSGSGGGRKGAAGLGVGTSGPNEFGETGVSGTGVTSPADHSTSAPVTTPEKGSHIPEATPKYSETNTIIGEASTWGKGAYKAFNGRIFSFDSSCTYTFCRHCVESGEDFNIEIKRNNNSDIEKIIVKIDTNDVSIFGDIILVNEESVQIPYNNKLIHIKKYGEYNVLNSRRGIMSLMWDKNNKLSLTLHKKYPTCGLCGNFNSTPGDDINEHIANSKIPGDCPKAVSKSYDVCEHGVQALTY